MTIQEKTPRERAAMQFKAAGLGTRSAVEAARLMFENGLPFESAAVLGQRLDEASTATPASIRKAAVSWERARNGPRTTTAYGRPIAEAEGLHVTSTPHAAVGGKQFAHPERTKVIDGVLHHEVSTYENVVEQEKRTHSPWGRKLED